MGPNRDDSVVSDGDGINWKLPFGLGHSLREARVLLYPASKFTVETLNTTCPGKGEVFSLHITVFAKHYPSNFRVTIIYNTHNSIFSIALNKCS